MNFQELYSYVKTKRKSGVEVSKELVQLHMKIAFPLASFIIVLFGAPIAALPRRSGLAFSFGATLIISFVYYVLLKFGQSLGYNEKLPPALAAWTGNIIFGVLGLVILFRSRK
jgi:lipopolysaccharide export system permease protein